MADYPSATATISAVGGKWLPIKDDDGKLEGLDVTYTDIHNIPSIDHLGFEVVDIELRNGDIRIQYAPEVEA